MSLNETRHECMDTWAAPLVSREAASWLLENLEEEKLLEFALTARQDRYGERCLSGLEISLGSLNNQRHRRILCPELARLLTASTRMRTAFFIISFPRARWFKWAEFLETTGEEWLIGHWRRAIRATGDLAIGVAMAIDDRPAIALRGERLLKRRSIWKNVSVRNPDALPSAWKNAARLLAPLYPSKGSREQPAKPEARIWNLANGYGTGTQADRTKGKKLIGRLQRLKRALKDEKERTRKIQALADQMETRYIVLRDKIDARVQEGISSILREICLPDDSGTDIWRWGLGGSTMDLAEEVERALQAQRKLDVRYGIRSVVVETLKELKSKLKEVHFAIKESIVTSPLLIKAKEHLEIEIQRLNQLISDSQDMPSPVGNAILHRAMALNMDERGLKELKDLILTVKMPPISRLINAGEQEELALRLERLLAKRTRLYQSLQIEDHPPAGSRQGGIKQIPNLPIFVSANADLCAASVLIVDGYNALKASAQWTAVEQPDFSMARRRFIGLWRKKSTDWAMVELVFDGSGPHTTMESKGNLCIIFTDDRLKSQRADEYIIDRMRRTKESEPSKRLFLVTADRGLREAVTRWCDYIIDPRWALIHYLGTS